jgi:DNA-binding NtrC family response regulator
MEQSDVLLVQDDRNLRDGLQQAFRAAGYKSVLEATDGGEGLEVFRQKRPSLVVTDLKTGGLDLLQRVRQEDPDAAVIVLMTRVPDAKAAIASLKLGAHAFLMQPINRDELLMTAERALERRQLLIEHREHQEAHGPLQGKRARNVLLVDDDRAVRGVLRQIFEAGGYTCRFSGDGYDALEVFKTWRPSLVVTDIQHPGLSANELIRQVRAVDGDVAVIVVAGGAPGAKTVVGLLKLGADAFLMKPVIVDELLITAERALERRQLLIERRKRQEGASSGP